MSQAVAYGSITVVDVTDLGQLTVQPSSNLPTSVIYDPNNNSYIPNWGSPGAQDATPLVLTPIVYYGADQLQYSALKSVVWSKKLDTGNVQVISSSVSESISNGVLTVSLNPFLNTNYSMVTYIVEAKYDEPTAGIERVAQGQITFTLVKHASLLKSVSIVGDSIFKYNEAGQVEGATSISLKANLTGGISITKWQYQDGNNWVTIVDGSNNPVTTNPYVFPLLVNSQLNPAFDNNKAVIRVLTNADGSGGDASSGVYDIHTITILRDGARGDKYTNATLTNEDQMIPYSIVDGAYILPDNFNTTSRIQIFRGGVDVTSQWTIQQAYEHVSASASRTTKDNDTVTVTGMTCPSGSTVPYETGSVTFTCTKSSYLQGQSQIIKVFSLVRVAGGSDGASPTIYSIEPDTIAVRKIVSTGATNNTYIPAVVTAYAFQQTGATKSPYVGRIKIIKNYTKAEYDAAGTKPTALYSTATTASGNNSNASSLAYTMAYLDPEIKSLLFLLYEENTWDDSKILDSQQVVVTFDGQRGEEGQEGEAAVNVVFGNSADVIACDKTNKVISQQIIRIPFSAYLGTEAISCNFNISTAVLNFGGSPAVTIQAQATNASSNPSRQAVKSGNSYTQGEIVFVIPKNRVITNPNGSTSISFTALHPTDSNKNKTVHESYSWSRSSNGLDGQNAVFLQIFAPNGNTFTSTINTVVLEAKLYNGNTDVTSSGTNPAWYKFNGTGYDAKADDTSDGDPTKLTINSSSVDSYASFKFSITYGGQTYDAYFSVFDKTDPIQVSVLSSVGSQLVNGAGAGALYVIVTRNGVQIDSLPTKQFFVDNARPVNPATNDLIFNVLTTGTNAKSVKLLKYNGSTWAAQTDPTYTGYYKWSWRDKNGELKTTYGSSTPMPGLTKSHANKVIYIDGDMVDSKIIADVQVTI